MNFGDLHKYDLTNYHLLESVTIKEILELEAKTKPNNETGDEWVEKFLTSIQPLFWDKWLEIIYKTKKIPVFRDFKRFSNSYKETDEPHLYDEWTDWFEIFETKPSGFLEANALYQFPCSEWAQTNGLLPESLDDFYKKANSPNCRKYIIRYLCWYFTTKFEHLEKPRYKGFGFKPRGNTCKYNTEGLEFDPSGFFWDVKSIKNYDYSRKNAYKQMKLTSKLLMHVENIFSQY